MRCLLQSFFFGISWSSYPLSCLLVEASSLALAQPRLPWFAVLPAMQGISGLFGSGLVRQLAAGWQSKGKTRAEEG